MMVCQEDAIGGRKARGFAYAMVQPIATSLSLGYRGVDSHPVPFIMATKMSYVRWNSSELTKLKQIPRCSL